MTFIALLCHCCTVMLVLTLPPVPVYPGCYNTTESSGLGSPNRFKTKVAPKVGGGRSQAQHGMQSYRA